ncbi:MAG: hypothetical protein R3F43_18945 [bacterium]
MPAVLHLPRRPRWPLAYGNGFRVEIGITTAMDEVLAVQVMDAWTAVGVKNDGSPSDLEIFLLTEQGLWKVDVDDLGVAAASSPVDLAVNNLRITAVDRRFDFVVGRLTVEAYAPDGDVRFSANGQTADGDAVVLNVSGRLRQ